MTALRLLIAAALAFPLVAMSPANPGAQASGITYFNQFVAGGAVSPTDTLLACQTAAGCGPSTPLSVITAAQIESFVLASLTPGKLPLTPPHYLPGAYTVSASDIGLPVCLKGSNGPVTFTLPPPATAGFGNGARLTVCNTDPNPLTLTTSGGSILSLAVNPLTQGMWAELVDDGTNWLAFESGGAPLTGSVLGVGP